MTPEETKAIAEAIRQELDATDLARQVQVTTADVNLVKADVHILKKDVERLQGDVSTALTTLSEINKTVSHMSGHMPHMATKAEVERGKWSMVVSLGAFVVSGLAAVGRFWVKAEGGG